MRKGERMSPEARAHLSAVLMGHPVSQESRAKTAAGLRGRTLSPEHRERIRDGYRRGGLSPEGRARIIEAQHRRKGTKRTPEARERMRLSHIGKGIGNTHRNDAPVIGECVYCLGPAQTYDHMIARGRPGWDDPDNLVPACYICNQTKGQRTPEEWLADILSGSIDRQRSLAHAKRKPRAA